MRTFSRGAAVMAALAMLAVPALAAKSQLSGSDRNFVKKAAQGGVTEVTLGKLALNRAQSADVKQFGRRMVTDHSAANAKLAQVARIKGIALPKSPDKEQKGVINRLSRLSGAAFDRAYMQDMVKDHTKDVAEFQKESKKARDTDVKAFAAQTLPTLREHLAMARQTNARVSGKSTNVKTGTKSGGRGVRR